MGVERRKGGLEIKEREIKETAGNKFSRGDKYLGFTCPHCHKKGVITPSMKNLEITCSFCGKEIIEFKLKDLTKKEANVQKVIAEILNPKLLVKEELNLGEVEPVESKKHLKKLS
jgi:ribosomal protein S27E